MPGAFPELQKVYERHHVATYPLTDSKAPMVTAPQKVGAPGSRQLAIKFPEANAAGFDAGVRNRLTIVDIDSSDERLVAEIQRRFGVTPLQVITPSGGRHLYYRHAGETRRIRALPDVDILGRGNVVAAGSIVPRGKYAIERGSLDDLANLPPLRADTVRHTTTVIPIGERNNAIFKHARKIAHTFKTPEELIEAVLHWADNNLDGPMSQSEIEKTCRSAWAYRGGRKRIVNHVIESDAYDTLKRDPAALGILAFLSAENGEDAEFMIADGLAEANGWPRRLVPTVRRKLLEMGIIRCVRPHGKGRPGLYRWNAPQ